MVATHQSQSVLPTFAEALEWFNGLPSDVKAFPEWEKLSDGQFVAVYVCCAGKYKAVSMLGRAGSGKTFVTKFCCLILRALGADVRVVGTTGVATQNAGGLSTLNRFVGIGTGQVLPVSYWDDVNNHWPRKNAARCARDCEANFKVNGKVTRQELVVFVDEMSMASSENLLLLYQVVAQNCKNRPFRFVLVGDMRQLLAVSKEENFPWKTFTSLPFEPARFNPGGSEKTIQFGSLLTEGPFLQLDGDQIIKPVEDWSSFIFSLTDNFRQKESDGWFVDALNAVGDGEGFGSAKVAPLLNRVWQKQDDDSYVNVRTRAGLPDLTDALHIFNTNKQVQSWNQDVLATAKTRGAESVVFKAKVEIFDRNWDKAAVLREVSPIEEVTELAIGLKFMVRLNLPELSLSNGSIGTIVEFKTERKDGTNGILLEMPDGRRVWVGEVDVPLPKSTNGNPIGVFKALPGHLSHAMTPWKSQGLTVETDLVYHLNTYNPTHGLMYVVCSRVKRPDNLFILVSGKLLQKAIVCDPRVASFIQTAEKNMANILATNAETEADENDFEIEFAESDESTSVAQGGFVKELKPEYLDSCEDENRVAHVFRIGTLVYAVIYKDGVVDSSDQQDAGGEWTDKPMDRFLVSVTDKEVVALGLPTSVVNTPVAAAAAVDVAEVAPEEVEELAPPVEYPPIWSADPEMPGNVLVRDLSIPDAGTGWEDGVLVKETETMAIYRVTSPAGVTVGALIKKAAEVGTKLMEDDAAFEWFKAKIQFVAFKPETEDPEEEEDDGYRPQVILETRPGDGYTFPTPYVVGKDGTEEECIELYKEFLWADVVEQKDAYWAAKRLAERALNGSEIVLPEDGETYHLDVVHKLISLFMEGVIQ